MEENKRRVVGAVVNGTYVPYKEEERMERIKNSFADRVREDLHKVEKHTSYPGPPPAAEVRAIQTLQEDVKRLALTVERQASLIDTFLDARRADKQAMTLLETAQAATRTSVEDLRRRSERAAADYASTQASINNLGARLGTTQNIDSDARSRLTRLEGLEAGTAKKTDLQSINERTVALEAYKLHIDKKVVADSNRTTLLGMKLEELGAQAAKVIAALDKELQRSEAQEPVYTRENGKQIKIKDMNAFHLQNAVLKCLREERTDVSMQTLQDLNAEADRRGLDWKSWRKTTEPVTKYATKD